MPQLPLPPDGTEEIHRNLGVHCAADQTVYVHDHGTVFHVHSEGGRQDFRRRSYSVPAAEVARTLHQSIRSDGSVSISSKDPAVIPDGNPRRRVRVRDSVRLPERKNWPDRLSRSGSVADFPAGRLWAGSPSSGTGSASEGATAPDPARAVDPVGTLTPPRS